MNGFNINNLTPFAVGFDRVLDRLAEQERHTRQPQGFPPYNIRKETDSKFYIDLAVAGLSQDDLEIKVEKGELVVRSTFDEKTFKGELLHRGISFKKFTRSFTLADDIKVRGADMQHGLLSIELERIVPDEDKPVTINIRNQKDDSKEFLTE